LDALDLGCSNNLVVLQRGWINRLAEIGLQLNDLLRKWSFLHGVRPLIIDFCSHNQQSAA
jgi:hypothetical protein